MKQKNYLTSIMIYILLSVQIFSQEVVVTGSVTASDDNQPLPWVSVIVKGSSKGTTTNFDGEYIIKISDKKAILVFSFVGYISQEIKVNSQSTINVKLQPLTEQLEEVVVIGYGTQKKAKITGAVSVVTIGDIESRPITSLSAGLSGLIPGVQVTQSSGGRIGANDASIRVRGIGTLNDSNPLVLIDGISSSMNDIDPNDIASISILKDAASAAIYGSRAANGVILITTKKGKKGRFSVSYKGYTGWQQATKVQRFVSDFATWMELANENKTNGGQKEIFGQSDIDEWRNSNDPLTHPNVDWYERQVGGNGFLQSHSFLVLGGTTKTIYRISLGYLDQDGLQKPNNQKRYNVRMNLESEIAKGIKLGTNLFYRWRDLNPTVNTSNGSGVDFVAVPSIPDIQGPSGVWGDSQHSAISIVSNPFANNAQRHANNRQQRFVGAVYVDWEIIPDFVFKAKVALNSNTSFDTSFSENFTSYNFRETDSEGNPTPDRVREYNSTSSSHGQSFLTTGLSTLDYKKSFGNHNLNVLVGYQSEIFRSDNVRATGSRSPNNSLRVIDAGLSKGGAGGNLSEWAILSYFGRLNYDFNSKYLFQVVVRADGSSRFKEGNRWGVFPSLSAGWRISEENFMQDNSVINNLKIRVSWGKLGNQSIGNYPYQATYALNQNYGFGHRTLPGIAQNSLPNPNITWETTTTTNFGIDAGFFNNRLDFTFDYFKKNTDAVLFEQQIPEFLGNKKAPIVNLAEVLNNGWEFSVNYRDRLNKDFNFSVGGNISIVKNEVTKFFGDTFQGGTFVIQEGEPFRAIRGLEAVGIFQSQEEIDNVVAEHPGAVAPGDIQYKDQLTIDTDDDGIFDEADGIIDSNDRVIIGNTIPKFLYSANARVNYKNFDLGIIIQGVSDVDTYAGAHFAYQALQQDDRGIIPNLWLEKRWTPENPGNELPRLVSSSSYMGNRQTSSFWVNDISYLRVKNIQLGYSFPTSIANKYGLNKVRLYVSADNAFTFTNWKWDYDPERGQTAGAPGLPNVSTFVLGFDVQF